MTQHPEIAVVGSVNLDLVASVPSLPLPGETVLASAYAEYPGGKGANQAIAAARLGRRVAFIGRVGDDAAADVMREALAVEGVDVERLLPVAHTATGRALISVDAAAENCIVVVPGANAALAPEHLDEETALAQAAVVVAQLEVPLAAVERAASLAAGRFVLNPAPARQLDPALLARVDVLVVNEGEFATVTGVEVPQDLPALADVLAGLALPCAVVITLGARGAAVWADAQLHVLDAPRVDVVDTTGAGDTFVGALADALVRGIELAEAARWAVAAGSLSTRRVGATSGMPTREEVEEFLLRRRSGS